jgi:cyanate permease
MQEWSAPRAAFAPVVWIGLTGMMVVGTPARLAVALFGAFFSRLIAVCLGFSWLPALLTSGGSEPATASSGTSVFNLDGVAGALAGRVAIRRLGLRVPRLAMTAGATADDVTLSAMRIDVSQPVLPTLVMLTLTGGLINAVQTTMYALAAHVYTSAVRATAVGTAAAIGRSSYAGAWAIDYRDEHVVLPADRGCHVRHGHRAGHRQPPRARKRV